MAAAAPTPLAVLRGLLEDGSITIVTTLDGRPPADGAKLDAVTVVQIDGDVVTRVADPARVGAHLGQVRATLESLTALRRWIRIVDVLRLPAALGLQVPWITELARLVVEGHGRWPSIFDALMRDASFAGSFAFGAPMLILQRFAPRVFLEGLRLTSRLVAKETFSGRG